jgi:hypothetical protein
VSSHSAAESARPGTRARIEGRAFRGLALTFAFSFVNLVGVLITAASVGGLGDWSRWQFIGLYGLVEGASGAASIILPNIWHLPVAELQTDARVRVRLAASALLLPHWGGAARFVAGISILVAGVYQEGSLPDSLPAFAMLAPMAVIVLALFLLAARVGVARPDLDVFQLTIAWRRGVREVPPVSISASVLQFALAIVTIPVANVSRPEYLYGPGSEPLWTLAGLLVLSALLTACVRLAWAGRMTWRATREQQAEAEANA